MHAARDARVDLGTCAGKVNIFCELHFNGLRQKICTLKFAAIWYTPMGYGLCVCNYHVVKMSLELMLLSSTSIL